MSFAKIGKIEILIPRTIDTATREIFYDITAAVTVHILCSFRHKVLRWLVPQIYFNCSRAVWKYIRHLDSCDISDNSDSSDSTQEQTCLQDFATGNRHYYEFSWPWACAVCSCFSFMVTKSAGHWYNSHNSLGPKLKYRGTSKNISFFFVFLLQALSIYFHFLSAKPVLQ